MQRNYTFSLPKPPRTTPEYEAILSIPRKDIKAFIKSAVEKKKQKK
jgi:hypothetical protein